MDFLRNCSLYLKLILVFVGNSRGCNGYVKGMQILSFFHGIMSSRNRRNAIQFFMVNGVLVEGVESVRATVFDHFSSHFQNSHVNRPRMDGIQFRSLTCRQGVGLIKPFLMDEVKCGIAIVSSVRVLMVLHLDLLRIFGTC